MSLPSQPEPASTIDASAVRDVLPLVADADPGSEEGDDGWMIEADNVSKRYGDVVAVDRLDLKVKRGEIFGFLGPNGAGKTTTLRMLTGLLRPTSGRIRVGGFDLADDPLGARAQMAYLPDTPYLYDKLTGREFIHFVAGLYRIPTERVEARLVELLPLFELDGRADDLIEGYSHGMRQKTLMISALIHEPKVYFLDEPTVGLDPRSARLMRDIFRQLGDRGITVMLSTHILEIAERMCDRIAIIHRGRRIALGTIDELKRIAKKNETLEDIFLEVTGGAAYAELAQVLD